MSEYEKHYEEIDREIKLILTGFKAQFMDSFTKDDLVQELHIHIWKTWNQYDPMQSSLRTWIHRISRKKLIDILGKGRDVFGRKDYKDDIVPLDEYDSTNL